MPRLFVAIDLPERIRDDIIATYAAIPGARWVEEAQIHLTLRFIGDVSPDTMEDIIAALRSVSGTPFSLTLKGAGFFPPRRDPKVLWIGISECPELMRLQNQVERKLQNVRITPDNRKFHPHITIARLRNSPTEKIARFITEYSLFSTEPFSVSKFHLYQSFLRKEGAHHIIEASYNLVG